MLCTDSKASLRNKATSMFGQQHKGPCSSEEGERPNTAVTSTNVLAMAVNAVWFA